MLDSILCLPRFTIDCSCWWFKAHWLFHLDEYQKGVQDLNTIPGIVAVPK
ncbi:hypothetical protein [Acinetobacter baylyi]